MRTRVPVRLTPLQLVDGSGGDDGDNEVHNKSWGGGKWWGWWFGAGLFFGGD